MRSHYFPKLALVLAAAFSFAVPSLGKGETYTFASIDYPGSTGTAIYRVNNSGNMVGWYWDSQNQTHSFLDNGGTFSSIDYPGVSYTFAWGINDGGQITGNYLTPTAIHAFLDTGGTFSSIDYPGGTIATNGFGINNSGQIVGNYLIDNSSIVQGFLKDGVNFSTINYPGAAVGGTTLTGINDNGQIVGFYYNRFDGKGYGLLDTGGNISSIDYPGVGQTQYTLAEGINKKGQVVGYYDDSTGGHGFLKDAGAGAFTSIDYPGAEGHTYAHGINDNGQIVGYFIDGSGKSHGFLATPASDTTPPVTTANPSPAPNNNAWNNTNVAVNLNAADNPGGSGVKQIQFALGGAQNTGVQTVAGNAALVTISAEGTTVLSYFATDNAGNLESTKTLTVRIDKTPPVIVPTITGTLGNNGWYRSNVTVAWSVSDPESGIASSTGCATTTLTSDTAAVTLTCSATNRAGLSSSSSVPVTIKIDKTPPVISGMPAAGCRLWPPNRKLVQVSDVKASDALSGIVPGSLKVTGGSNEPSDPKDSDIVITPDGSGGFNLQLRAERLGTGTGRVYTLSATAMDIAGNTATTRAICTVPHNQGN